MFDFQKKNSLFKNIFLMVFGNVITQGANFVVFIYIAREFGPAIFGEYNWSKALVQYFILFAAFGFDNVAMIKILKEKNNFETMKYEYNRILLHKFLFSLISYILLIIFIVFFDGNNETKLMSILIGLSILTVSLNNTWFFRSFQQSEIPLITELIKITFYIIMVTINYFTLKSIIVIIISWVVAEIISYIYSNIKSPFKFTPFSTSISKDIVKLGTPFFISGFFATISLNIDILLIGILRDSEEVGYYSAMYKIVSLIMVISAIIFNAIKPILIENFYKKNIEFLSDFTLNIKKYCLIIVIPMGLYSSLFQKEIVNFIYGSQYASVSNVFALLMLYASIFLFREVFGYQMISYGLQNKYMNIVIATGILNFALNFLLIPKYGLIAAAVTTIVTEILNLILMKYFVDKIISDSIQFSFINRLVIVNLITYLFYFILERINFETNLISLIFIGLLYLVLLQKFNLFNFGSLINMLSNWRNKK